MGEAQTLGVLAQTHGELAIAEPAIALFRNTRPRTGVHLVDAQWLAGDLTLGAVLEPGFVTPDVVRASHARGGERRRFHLVCPRVGLDAEQALLGFELVLVQRAHAD